MDGIKHNRATKPMKKSNAPRTVLLDRDTWLQRMAERSRVCLAMYSSLVDGIVTDTACMVVPVDDHLVHRGDGVFETCKSVGRAVYNLPAHLQRLNTSGAGIGIQLPWREDEITTIVKETLRVAGSDDAAVRILVSRGPGTMGVGPRDCAGPQLYVLVYPLSPPFMSVHPAGTRIGYSQVPPKPPPFADIKHCNYLPNVLMAKEALERKLDFIISRDVQGRLLEGATENVAIVTKDHSLWTPSGSTVLSGTTMDRLFELAKDAAPQGIISSIDCHDLTVSDIEEAREVFIVGTTHDVIAVSEVEGRPTPHGPNGPVFKWLRVALSNDVRTNQALRTNW